MTVKRNAVSTSNGMANGTWHVAHGLPRPIPRQFSRRLFLSICLLSFAMCHVVRRAEARSNTAVRAFNDGVKDFNAKQFNDAIPHFDDALSSDSEFMEAYFARGACKYYLKNLDGALGDINDALRLKPNYLEARALRGAVNYELEHWDTALEDFNYVLDKNPHDAQSLLGRAVILLKREDLDGAAKDFKAFLRVRPDDPLAPKVRELLASLKRSAEPPPEEAPQAQNPEEPSAPARHHAVSKSPALSAADLQRLADGLMSHPLSESYDRKVLRGEKAQAVGDIRSDPGVPTERKAPAPDVQIVDPQ